MRDTASGYRVADVLVVGSGIAGCAAALEAARAGVDVLLVTKAEKPADASSDWAQGGIATTRGRPESLKTDVLEASSGTADEAAVDVLVEDAAAAVTDVLVDTLDVAFDEADDGAGLDFAREAAHSEDRILHVDAETGQHVLRPFLAHLETVENVQILEDTAALELVTHEGRVHGAVLDRQASAVPEVDRAERSDPVVSPPAAPTGEPVYAGATILATGGIGDLFATSTNPAGSTGDGIAMAALAGADVADMEFVQFHPTAYAGEDPFLLSEAVRGEGAHLLNGAGERFMPAYHEDAELAPRDVVARAVEAEREATGEVTLDVTVLEESIEGSAEGSAEGASHGSAEGASHGSAEGASHVSAEGASHVSAEEASHGSAEEAFPEAFPGLAEKCEARGVDWRSGIPVAPCEHFLCGGVTVDHHGRTTLDRLYAVGECARTGVHGANRLASTSLLEGLVWGRRAGRDAVGNEPVVVEAPDLLNSDPALPDRFAAEKFHRLRRVMSERVGLRRDLDDVARAQGVLRRLKGEVDAYVRTRTSRSLYELRNASVVALLVAKAAAENPESVGCHAVVGDESHGDSDLTAPDRRREEPAERTTQTEGTDPPETTPTPGPEDG